MGSWEVRKKKEDPMAKKLITESDILKVVRSGKRSLEIESATLLTPSARDVAKAHGIEIIDQKTIDERGKVFFQGVTLHHPLDTKSKRSSFVVAIGADHGGFQMKEMIKKYLLDQGFTIADVGTNSEEACDYPDFAYAVATLVSSGNAHRGIMIDAIGIASAITANKVTGIRAVPCWNEFVARSSREHNDANVLTLGGRVLGIEHAKSIVQVWLDTQFSGGRHQNRIKKISDIEKKFLL